MAINRDELLFVVDANNKPLKPLSRHEAHAKNSWHRSAHVWVANLAGQLLCQKRSRHKDIEPGLWEAIVGGHVLAGKTYLETAVDETKEEIGITASPQQLTEITTFQHFKQHNRDHNVFISAYLLRWDGQLSELTVEKDEIEQVVWQPLAVVRQKVVVEKSAEWCQVGYEAVMLNAIRQQVKH